ncbi:hypothetical protein CH359_09115 [Leptospira meyeri]|nr:hypothetical protein CH359_09115 [Leptospira meyeri]PJZ96733.1 hypothetical protein CH358_10785 [Leptospira meyeri]
MNTIFTNSYILLLPILFWNFHFYDKLPFLYQPTEFNRDIPIYILIGENIFRSIIFILPLVLKLNWKSNRALVGFILYCVGSVLYYFSWLALIYLPNSLWSKNFFGFLAPAYTPIIWLIGISMIADRFYFRFRYSKWNLMIPSAFFIIFHVSHATFVFIRNN